MRGKWIYTDPFAILCCPTCFENCSASRDMRAQLTALFSTLFFRLSRKKTAQLRRWCGALAHGAATCFYTVNLCQLPEMCWQRERGGVRYGRGNPNTCVKATSSCVNNTAHSLSTCAHVMGPRSRSCTSNTWIAVTYAAVQQLS